MPSGGCSSVAEASRSGRFASRAASELRRETLVAPCPELGLVAADGPRDPDPELVVGDAGELGGTFDAVRELRAPGGACDLGLERERLPGGAHVGRRECAVAC